MSVQGQQDKPWLPSPDDKQDEQGHVWFDVDNMEACKRCGIVKRRDGKNSTCRGTTGGVGLR